MRIQAGLFYVVLAAALQPALAQEEPKGPYLGQAHPGETPVKFAPGLISTDEAFELNSVFSPDGKMFLFSRRVDGQFKIFISEQQAEGGWSKPAIAPFSRTYPGHGDVDMMFAPGGKRLYFISGRPLAGYPLDQYNIYFTDRTAFGWTPPAPLGPEINRPPHELYPMIVGDGSLYFSAARPDAIGGRDSYRAQYLGGAFATPVNLGPAINSAANEGDIFVAADESYLIHSVTGRDDSLGSGDLYIAFRQTDGSWGKDIHMGPVINSEGIDFCPMVTPDGKYFMFSRAGDIYWVDAKILQEYQR